MTKDINPEGIRGERSRIGGRRRRVAVILAATALATSVAPTATASAQGRRSPHVEFTLASPVTAENFVEAFVPDVSRCAAFAPDDLPCVVPVTATPGFDLTFTGSVQGSAASASGFVLGALIDASPSGFSNAFVAMNRVVGTVDGCGTGTFVLQTEGNLNSPSGTWKVVAGTGTGELGGITGSGRSLRDLGSATVHETFTGKVTCEHRTGRHTPG